ncbi:inositol-3-phosphate synthase [Bacillus cereus]|nr:inositol-3-phosphate synthase [Bacillus cereus]PGU68133.1 inositol-3-phosphate synthase [Bacillus cereus]
MNKKVRVAIVGVGNCASSLVQGIEYYKNASSADTIPGLMNVELGDYHIGDIEFSAAFDINETKVGKDLSQAIFASPNNTHKFSDVPFLDIPVRRGLTADGLGYYLEDIIDESAEEPDDFVQTLINTKTDVVVSFLPVGSELATQHYVEGILEAGCGFVNCIPVFIASDDAWAQKFRDKGLPIVGDDIKSQFGATIIHRVLTNLLVERGVHLDRTYQLNFGGNMDFYNMLERSRLVNKKISKTNAVKSQLREEILDNNIHVGPSDYVSWLDDRKWCHIRMEGTTFGDVPLNLELKLEVWDSPNSAGVVIDAVRCAKIALDRGISGPIEGPASYFMKSPPVQYTDNEAKVLTQQFILDETKVKN